jgi:hypothetical protein
VGQGAAQAGKGRLISLKGVAQEITGGLWRDGDDEEDDDRFFSFPSVLDL